MLFQYAIVHYDLGQSDEAEDLLVALMKNCFVFTTEYNRKRCKSISTKAAKVYVEKKEYKKAQDCVDYVLGRLADTVDTRILFEILSLQQEIFNCYENKKGAEVIDEFLRASARMINYLHRSILYANK